MTVRKVFIFPRSPPILNFVLGWSDNCVEFRFGHIQSVTVLQYMVSKMAITNMLFTFTVRKSTIRVVHLRSILQIITQKSLLVRPKNYSFWSKSYNFILPRNPFQKGNYYLLF